MCIFLEIYCYGQSCTQYRFRPSGKSLPSMLLNAGMVLSMVQFSWFGKWPSIIIRPSEFGKVWGPEHLFSYCDPVISPKPSYYIFLGIWLHLSAAPACIVTTTPSRTGLNPAQWRHMATEIWVNIGLGNGLLPDGTKPLPEPMLTDQQWSQLTY